DCLASESLDPLVDVCQAQVDLWTGKGHSAVVSKVQGIEPGVVLGAIVAQHPTLVLKNDDVCTQASDAVVCDELFAQVNRRCDGRKHLDHHTWRRGVHLVGVSAVADDLDVGVINRAVSYAQAHVAPVDAARPATCRHPELREDIPRYSIMAFRRARERVELPRHILML